MNIRVYGARVESKANVADGPSRDFLDVVRAVDAVRRGREPVLPEWVFDLWSFPVAHSEEKRRLRGLRDF